MPPTNVLRVLFVSVLRIHDRYVAALEELNHLCALSYRKVARLLLADSIARGELQFEQLVRLIVGEVGHRAGACEETVTRADAWMIGELVVRFDFPDLKFCFLEF